VRLRLVSLALVAIVVGACTADQFVVVDNDPIDPNGLGPVFPRADAPPLECRDIPRDPCVNVGNLDQGAVGVAIEEIARVVVTCQAPRCDDLSGEYRVDAVVRDGSTLHVGTGGYSTTP
jgi:hypothetical protein